MISLKPIRVSIYAVCFLIPFGQVWCQTNCGKTFGSDLEEYLMGGEDAEQGYWPWMVALFELNETKGDPRPICTGFLIDNRHVITAAHCFRTNKTSFYSTRIGHVNLTLGDVYPISHIAVHEGFERGRFDDDIALLTLSKDVNVPNFNPVCLPPRGTLKNLTARGTTFVGWGATSQGGEVSLVLKQLRAIPVKSNEYCNDVWGRFLRFVPQGITSRMICAGFQDEPERDICWGDSGGPLMIQEQNRWYVVGVAAFGYSCGRPDYPAVYTRVSEYWNWINVKKDLEIKPIEDNQQSHLDYPFFNGQCVNSSEGQNACKDIRECDFAISILANGGWPKVCGLVNNEDSENNPPRKWPKVCCGIPQKERETLITAFAIEEERNNFSSCGKISAEAKEQGSWPWMVRLQPEPHQPCVAAMIDRRHFIAQSKCFPNFGLQNVTATIGTIESNQIYNVIDVKFFLERNTEHFRAEIALGTLSRDVEDPDFSPICLPYSLADRNLTKMDTTSIAFTPKKMVNNFYVISNYECNMGLTKWNMNEISERHICTKCSVISCLFYDHMLMLKDQGRWNLIGMTPFSIQWCLITLKPPLYYIKVSEYLDWIKKNTN